MIFLNPIVFFKKNSYRSGLRPRAGSNFAKLLNPKETDGPSHIFPHQHFQVTFSCNFTKKNNSYNGYNIFFPGWLELRKCLHDGIVLVDLEVHSFSHLCELIATELINKEFVNNEIAEQLQELWQKKHR